MTDTLFVMRLVLSPTTSIDVAITGTGMKYDPTSGMILSGEIGSIAMSNYAGTGKVQSLIDTRQINNLDMDSMRLADAFGDKFWNNAKLVVDMFDKLAAMNEGGSVSYFSRFKSDAFGSENDDAITGTKFNDEMSGQGGDDDLFGGAGTDRIFGDMGDDALAGDAGNDVLFDLDGNNQFDGGTGNDVLQGGVGVDQFDGGKGRDILLGGGGYDWARGGDDADQFVFSVKDSGKLTVLDFTKADSLVNMSLGSRDEAYRDFMDHARQSGRNVVYDAGEMHVVLKGYKLADLQVENFSDASGIPDLWPVLS